MSLTFLVAGLIFIFDCTERDGVLILILLFIVTFQVICAETSVVSPLPQTALLTFTSDGGSQPLLFFLFNSTIDNVEKRNEDRKKGIQFLLAIVRQVCGYKADNFIY